MEADVFSQPIGFIPRFPAPPRYIKVRIHNRKQKDFDRVFLAQEVHGKPAPRKASKENKAPSATVSENLTAPTKSGSAIWALEFSKDGKHLAAGGQDKVVRVWSVLSTPEDRLAHESEEDAKGGDEPAVRLNAPVFKSKTIQEYEGHTASVLDLSWSKVRWTPRLGGNVLIGAEQLPSFLLHGQNG
jgi:WD repeat-containing protein 44